MGQGVRLSPDLRYALVWENEKQQKIVELDHFNQQKRMERKFKIETREQFDKIVFLSNKYFAVPDTSDKVYNVFRVEDKSLLCRFDSSDYQFIRNSTLSESISPLISGILDRKTDKLYPIHLKTFLHLGAERMHVFPKDLQAEPKCERFLNGII